MADNATLQGLVNDTPDGGVLRLTTRQWTLDGSAMIEIRKSITIDFQGAEIFFQWESSDGDDGKNKGFKVVAGGFPKPDPGQPDPTVYKARVIFRNGVFNAASGPNAYKNHYGPVITSNSGVEIGLFQVDSCVFKNLTYGPSFNSSNAGYIRNAILSNCLIENIIQKDPNATDPERGKGAAFSLRRDKDATDGPSTAHSYGNVFRKCQRHSLYVSTGGPFVSRGDSFYENSVATTTNYPLAAIALSRGSHMILANAYFEGCRDAVASFNDGPIQINQPLIQAFDVAITDSTFVNQTRGDIWLNSEDPNIDGMFRDQVVDGTRHYNTDPTNHTAITIRNFRGGLVRDVNISKRPSSSSGADFSEIFVNALGHNVPKPTSSGEADREVFIDDLLISGVKMSWDPQLTGTRRVVLVGPTAFTTGGPEPHVVIDPVDIQKDPDIDPVYASDPLNDNLVSPVPLWTCTPST
ncbi:MAG: hypothetical protein KDA80_14125 [Planctomycetaceae bacterium]|nr:hypothetical protein [Planctomycetaceae bacterium]